MANIISSIAKNRYQGGIYAIATGKKSKPDTDHGDESCGDEHDAERLIYIGACDYFNIKLGKSGGIFKALKMVKLAEANNIHLQVGAMMESRLAMTAFAHFSLCSPMIEHFDFDTALMFSEDPVSGGIVYEKNGVVKVPEATGLGARIDEDRLADIGESDNLKISSLLYPQLQLPLLYHAGANIWRKRNY